MSARYRDSESVVKNKEFSMETQRNIIASKQLEESNFQMRGESLALTSSQNGSTSFQQYKSDKQSEEVSDSRILHNNEYPFVNIQMYSNMTHTEMPALDFDPNVPYYSASNNRDHFVGKKKKRHFRYTDNGKLVILPEYKLQYPASFSENKQQEVQRAAQSLFYKRTRTLYHWMYPQAAKQQINMAVASSWEMLGKDEKDFYISQVLGRFGFHQMNLMINPQLDTIKQLPPAPPPACPRPTKSHELQSAISSISSQNVISPSSLTFEEFEEINERFKKRRGRPKGSITKKCKLNPTQDFQDDPELSQELEKFAVRYNLSRM